MKYRGRKTFRFGLSWLNFYATITQSGRRSYGVQVGPVKHNFTRRTTSIDTPGIGGFHHQHGRK